MYLIGEMQPPQGSWLVLLLALSRLGFQFLFQIPCPQMMQWIQIATVGRPVAVHCILVSLEKWAVLMDGATNRSLISAYFFTAQTYKHMHLITRVYGINAVQICLQVSCRYAVALKCLKP